MIAIERADGSRHATAMSPPRRARAWMRDLPWIILGLGVMLALWFTDPASSGLAPPCPVRWATGYACPGCGSGRALHALLHGALGRAFRLNPVAVMALPVVAVGFAILARARWTGRAGSLWASVAPRARARLVWGVLAGLLLWAVARNLMGWVP